jgi:hypothetical protein
MTDFEQEFSIPDRSKKVKTAAKAKHWLNVDPYSVFNIPNIVESLLKTLVYRCTSESASQS